MKKLITFTILGLLLTASTVTSKAISLTDAAPVHAKDSLKSAGQTVTRPLTKSVAYGGDGGTQFDDIAELGSTNIYGVHSINISSGDLVDSIEVFYLLKNKTIRGARHGKSSNPPVNIVLDPREEIVKIEGRIYNSQLVGQLTITTIGPSYVKKTYGPFGKIGSLFFELEGQIIGFQGRSGDSLDQIGVYSLEKMTKSDLYGSTSASPFDDISDLGYPPIVSLKSINVWSRPEMILAIQAEYLLLDGSTLKGGRHGFLYTDNITTIALEAGDQVISMDGMIATSQLNQNKFIAKLSFTVAKRNGDIIKYGPFGKWGIEAFNVRGNIIGIYGESGSNIYKIGAYYVSEQLS
ncbi:PREDICTED: jacalin-related lectin 23-like [Amphimedon queenslandica]|uniref:Jacalin-type lectin domain-containing protein n=1 Tax=Amphimedon queenslandica TaxID=400682 RepID=A0A1X7TMU5_AMPQE|nr:PREDICTED: jacalin-related lectin 23-like [Amphimedon queenslandica]|eukprot:XP_011407205.1 PREDICTED: jacalin-related lectin 23-like [Amphimedon queenslandica]